MVAELEALQSAHAAEQARAAALEEQQQVLEHTIDVAGKALKHVVDYPLEKEEIEQAKQAVPLHPDVDEDTHHVLTNQDDSILSEDLQTAVQAFQQSMRDIQKMQSAVQHSQTKVTESVHAHPTHTLPKETPASLFYHNSLRLLWWMLPCADVC